MHRTKANTRFLIAVLLFCAFSFSGFSQSYEKRFVRGESLTYEIFYYFMGVWMAAGDVTFTVGESDFVGTPCYHFKGYGKTHKRYDWFYKVRDTYESYASKEDLRPYHFIRDVSEGGFYYREENIYNYNDSNVYSVLKVKEKPLQLDTFPIKKGGFDVLGLVYHARSIDFSAYRMGDKIPIRMVIDRETFDLHIRYLGSDIYAHPDFGEINCYVFSPLLVEGSIFKEGEGMKVYVSKDQNRIPIYIESEIRVGEIRSKLKAYEGLKYPFQP
ncbi:MAG: DUF3108 domain-containing protein [Salibacteraceae bacterium]